MPAECHTKATSRKNIWPCSRHISAAAAAASAKVFDVAQVRWVPGPWKIRLVGVIRKGGWEGPRGDRLMCGWPGISRLSKVVWSAAVTVVVLAFCERMLQRGVQLPECGSEK